MIHSPRILVLDEPFESVDPVSSANLKDILIEYAKTGGTVIISSHVMALVEKMCTHVAVINDGLVCAAGTVDEVAAGEELEDRFLQLVGGRHEVADLQAFRCDYVSLLAVLVEQQSDIGASVWIVFNSLNCCWNTIFIISLKVNKSVFSSRSTSAV